MVEAFTEFSAKYFEMWKLKHRVFAGSIVAGDSQRAMELKQAGAAIVRRFQQHPEWFTGSSVKAEGFDSRDWPVAALQQQMTTVAATAAYLTEEQERFDATQTRRKLQFTPLGRGEHSWYKTWQSQPIGLGPRIVGGFTFTSQPNEVITYKEDNRHDGKVKFQWLHANARNLEPEKANSYVATVEAEGRAGLLRLQLVSAARQSANGQILHAESMLEFGDQLAERTFRAVIEPAILVGERTTPNLQLRLIWNPTQVDSELSGSATLMNATARTDPGRLRRQDRESVRFRGR